MNTRSKSTHEIDALFDVNIDFDDASVAWKENKKSIGNGQYKYICTKLLKNNKNNKKCNRKCGLNSEFCKMHSKYIDK